MGRQEVSGPGSAWCRSRAALEDSGSSVSASGFSQAGVASKGFPEVIEVTPDYLGAGGDKTILQSLLVAHSFVMAAKDWLIQRYGPLRWDPFANDLDIIFQLPVASIPKEGYSGGAAFTGES